MIQLHYAILGIGALLAAGWLLYQQWQIWRMSTSERALRFVNKREIRR